MKLIGRSQDKYFSNYRYIFFLFLCCGLFYYMLKSNYLNDRSGDFQVVQKTRINWIDIAKAICIFLIAYGHTVRGNSPLMNSFSFHTACFFLLSGMTCNTDFLKARIRKDFKTIMVPYYCFGILSILIYSFLGKFASAALSTDVNMSIAKNIWDLLYALPGAERLKFNMPLWFLPCLFATKITYYALDKLCRGKTLYVFICSIVLCGLGFLYTRLIGFGLPFNLAISAKMLVFFVVGRIFYLYIIAQEIAHKDRYLLLGIAFLCTNAILAFYAPRISYAGDLFPNIPAFLLTAFLGSFGVCFLSISIGKCKPMEHVGRHTLAVLTMHKFPILFFQTIGPFAIWLTKYSTLMGVVSSILVAFISVIMCLLVEPIVTRFFPFLFGDFYHFTICKRRSSNIS